MYTDEILEHLNSMPLPPETLEIISAEPVGEDAIFGIFKADGHRQSFVYYPKDDILFTPHDWDGDHPATVADIEKFKWINSAGDEALVLFGLPRVFLSMRDDARKAFGEKIREMRENKGYSQEQLAQKAGLLKPNLSRIESGRYGVTLDTITRLSVALGEDLI